LGYAGSGRIWLSNVDCKGGEKDFFKCPGVEGYWGKHNCQHYEDVFMHLCLMIRIHLVFTFFQKKKRKKNYYACIRTHMGIT